MKSTENKEKAIDEIVKIIKNFQRKYRQKRINGIIDFETLKLSQILSKTSN